MKQTPILLAIPLLMMPLASQSRAQNGATKPSQNITRAGSQASTVGPAANFTGNVTVDPLFAPNANVSYASYSGAYINFEAGARSAWHTHPAGQRLVVTQGTGRTAQRGGPVRELKVGDVV